MERENYITDLSTESLINQSNSTNNTPASTPNNSLGETKIMNINDFIFRQNLEFYPNLAGIKCRNNELILEENGEVISSETLTFDLRTLPGHVWNYDAKKFMSVIKFNKECLDLSSAADYISEVAYTPSIRERVI